MDMKNRWSRLWSNTSDACAAEVAFTSLCARYSEPHRAYHTLKHIEDCLTVFDRYKHLARDPLVVEAAIWWHDFVYETKEAKNNEQQSADVAQSEMALFGCSVSLQKQVANAILATKHNGEVTDEDQNLLLDIDLHILCVSLRRYKQYTVAIRKEYEWIPWEEYAKARIQILQNFLDRDTIFYHKAFVERYEAKARFNLRQEISFLRREVTKA
jgi:predicted metal-dependent HD superfamily phosphohydrolase